MDKLKGFLFDAFGFYKRNFLGIWNLLYPLILPIAAINAMFVTSVEVGGEDSSLLLSIELFSYPIIQAAIILYVSSTISGATFSRSQIYQKALKFWFPLFIFYVVYGLAVLMGIIALIVPGLILLVRLMFGEFYIIFNKDNPIDACKRSFHQTKEYQWVLFFGIFLIACLMGFVEYLLNYILTSLGASPAVSSFVFSLVASMLYCLMTIFIYRLFSYDLDRLQVGPEDDSENNVV
jgi:hypothetical protein